ncbi:MAG: AAA family ATPase [Candidatus Cloacimonetes bacterium]|nr:AAA family ATPase [Candidatus Cloacimonadota bacterium]
MNKSNQPVDQQTDRQRYTQLIIDSKADKKLIVAGPGTGKTTTFEFILEQSKTTDNIVMTFINRLVNDMKCRLSKYAKVQTFHSFCMMILQTQLPSWYIVPALGKIIGEDIDIDESGINALFHNLQGSHDSIVKFLERADYYKSFGFNDSIFRVLYMARTNPMIIPRFSNILIDEFQDFSALEVAFIKELENHGNLLIVGDDDQAIYAGKFDFGRSIRDLYNTGIYYIFELPYCSRCPKIIVDATNDIIKEAKFRGHLQDRINKQFIAFEPGHEEINRSYPKLTVYNMSSMKAFNLFIIEAIQSILDENIEEHTRNNPQEPLVLVIGTRKYLNCVKENLLDSFPDRVDLGETKKQQTQISDGYRILMKDIDSNIGWRIIMQQSKPRLRKYKTILANSLDGTPLVTLLPKSFVEKHVSIVSLIKSMKRKGCADDETLRNLETLIGSQFVDDVYKNCVLENDKNDQCEEILPIQLSTYQGCKGLAADYVFIIGINNGDLPVDLKRITDFEICQFIVAMTRTRRECYILPILNFYGESKRPSEFISWISRDKKSEAFNVSIDYVRQCITNSLKTN